MKFTLSYILIMYLFVTSANGQGMKHIQVESNAIVEMPTEQAWSIVQDWQNLHQLAPTVVESTIVQGEGLHSTWDINLVNGGSITCLLYTSPSPRDATLSRMPSSA